MRKDVKLGMAIGGGLIVLLVGYLLLAPPSNNNKKGTQLASGGSAGNIIDSAGPGDLIGNDEKGKPAGELNNTGNAAGGNTAGGNTANGGNSGNGNLTRANGASGNSAAGNPKNGADARPTGTGAKTSDTPAKTTDNPKPTVDQWGNALEKGKTGTAGGTNLKETEHTKVKRHETGEGRAAPASTDSPKLLYNPNDAWGGGVSTDAVFGNGHSGKTDLAANTTASKTGTSAVTESVGEAGGTHVVKSGETLSSIALSAYGSTAYYPHILRANPGINPNNLKLGTTLKLPHVSEVKADKISEHGEEHSAAPAALEVKIDPSKQYRVQPGDSLYKISMKVYGKSTFVDKIYEKNKVAIGADNKRLKLGMILDLPEKAMSAAASPSDPTTSSLSDPATEENQAK